MLLYRYTSECHGTLVWELIHFKTPCSIKKKINFYCNCMYAVRIVVMRCIFNVVDLWNEM